MQFFIKKFLVAFLFFSLIFTNKLFSQVSGSLFLIPDNFYAQILNPSFMRHDEAIQIAVPGLAGFSLSNQGNFKISDLIRVDENRKPYVDFNYFYGQGNIKNNIEQVLTVPVFFAGVPVNKGRISFYYQENVQTFTSFNIKPIRFLINGNVDPENHSFNTEDINISTLGYKEFALGYARILNNKLDVGMRFKILFGEMYANLNNWNYRLTTSESGDQVHLQTEGYGQLYLPVSMQLTEINQIDGINSQNFLREYVTTMRNPGVAVDLGLNYKIDKKNSVSFALRDFGNLWFGKNALNIEQRGNLNFSGFDFTEATRYSGRLSYIYPWNLMEDKKDSIREVFLPFVDTASFTQNLPVKTALTYQFKYTDKLLFGLTNQTIFLTNNIHNKLTLTALQKSSNLSFFENINLFNVDEINIGGGFQYEGKYAQVFFALENFLAVYHPAGQKAFSFSCGASFLINREKEELEGKQKESAKSGRYRSKGKISKYLPFYRIKD